LGDDIDFVLECAGHEAVGRFGPACLERGIDLGVLSVGALADDALTAALREASGRGAARLVVVPGAIGGIDALAAAGTGLARVRYTGHKPPRAWAGSAAEATHDLGGIIKATPVFRGSARDACLRFPKNANVVATVALAGIGFDRTEVELVADPAASGNAHRIAASGGGFDLDYTTRGPALAANPRTSALTALSAVRALRQRGGGLQV
jgi:aspartate dehydrogenase